MFSLFEKLPTSYPTWQISVNPGLIFCFLGFAYDNSVSDSACFPLGNILNTLSALLRLEREPCKLALALNIEQNFLPELLNIKAVFLRQFPVAGT